MSESEHIGWRLYEWCRPKSLADALQILGAVVATLWFVFTTDFGQWRPILPLLAVAFFCFVLWAISLVRQMLYSPATLPAPTAKAADPIRTELETIRTNPAPLPSPPRQLSPYEAEQKLKVIDSALLILRDEFPPALQRARQLESGAWAAFKHHTHNATYIVDLTACRDSLGHAANSIESVRQRNPEYRDISDALQQPPQGISLEAAMSHYLVAYQYLSVHLKDDAPSDALEYPLAPRRLELRTTLDMFDNWRRQAEARLIDLRRTVSP